MPQSSPLARLAPQPGPCAQGSTQPSIVEHQHQREPKAKLCCELTTKPTSITETHATLGGFCSPATVRGQVFGRRKTTKPSDALHARTVQGLNLTPRY